MFSKAKDKAKAQAQKAKDKANEAGDKVSDASDKLMEGFLEQMQIIGPAMKDSGFKLVDISLIVQLVPELEFTVDNTDETGQASFDDSRLDETKLTKTGKTIVWGLKKAAAARTKFQKVDSVQFMSFKVKISLSPSMTLSFKPTGKKLKSEDAESEDQKEAEAPAVTAEPPKDNMEVQ